MRGEGVTSVSPHLEIGQIGGNLFSVGLSIISRKMHELEYAYKHVYKMKKMNEDYYHSDSIQITSARLHDHYLID